MLLPHVLPWEPHCRALPHPRLSPGPGCTEDIIIIYEILC